MFISNPLEFSEIGLRGVYYCYADAVHYGRVVYIDYSRLKVAIPL